VVAGEASRIMASSSSGTAGEECEVEPMMKQQCCPLMPIPIQLASDDEGLSG